MHIILSSNGASSVLGDEWLYLWPKSIVLGAPDQNITVGLQHLQFWHRQYNVRSDSNTLIVNGQACELTPGWYDASTLATSLTTGLQGVANVAFVETTTRFHVTANTVVTIDGSSTLLPALGFESGTSYSGNAITAPSFCSLGGPTYVDLKTSLPTDNVQDENQATGLLARVPLTVSFGELEVYSPTLTHSTVKAHLLTRLRVSLIDSEGNALDTQWSMTLFFQATGVSSYRPLETSYQASDLIFNASDEVIPSDTSDNA